MFQAFVLDGDQLIPKTVPQAFKGFLEGDGRPDTVKKITSGDGLFTWSQFNYVKHKVESIDKDNFRYRYSVIVVDALMNTLEKITYETKLETSPDEGSICESISKYYTIDGLKIKEDQIKSGKEKALGLFKAIEAYLLANPYAN